jgi:hypothetical protein
MPRLIIHTYRYRRLNPFELREEQKKVNRVREVGKIDRKTGTKAEGNEKPSDEGRITCTTQTNGKGER